MNGRREGGNEWEEEGRRGDVGRGAAVGRGKNKWDWQEETNVKALAPGAEAGDGREKGGVGRGRTGARSCSVPEPVRVSERERGRLGTIRDRAQARSRPPRRLVLPPSSLSPPVCVRLGPHLSQSSFAPTVLAPSLPPPHSLRIPSRRPPSPFVFLPHTCPAHQHASFSRALRCLAPSDLPSISLHPPSHRAFQLPHPFPIVVFTD